MTTPNGAAKPPVKLWEHIQRVYERMEASAFVDDVSDGGDTRTITVWEGFTTALFRDLDLPTPYYTKCLNRLRRMGCIVQLSRGGGNAPSRWELVEPPMLEKFEDAADTRKRTPTRIGILEQRYSDLLQRVEGLEQRLVQVERNP